MQEYQNSRLRALLIRTTLEEQQELEDIQQRMYQPKAHGGKRSAGYSPRVPRSAQVT